MKRRIFNKAGYIIRIGGQFAVQPGRGAIIPAELAKDPAIDRYIRAGIFEGDLLGEEKPKAAPTPKKEEPKAVEPEPEVKETKPEEAPAEEEPKEEKPKSKGRKRSSKAKAE